MDSREFSEIIKWKHPAHKAPLNNMLSYMILLVVVKF